MIDFSRGTVSKSKTISRRMFILSVAKVVVFTGIVGRLVSLQINESKNTELYQTKIDSENGGLLLKEEL